MSDLDLHAAILSFEQVLSSCERLHKARNIVTKPLCELYKMKSARAVRSCVGLQMGIDLDTRRNYMQLECNDAARNKLPDSEVVHRRARELLAAVESRDADGALNALDEMGVSALCPTMEELFSRLEIAIAGATGRPRIIPLVELSIFATELGDCKKASEYASEAHALGLGATELHDLYSVEGVVALTEGDVAKAVSSLKDSTDVCMIDEFAYLTCSIRAPNLMLANKLLDCGERKEVLRFLTECQNIWKHHVQQFVIWIDEVHNDKIRELRATGILDALSHPSVRILQLNTRATLLDDDDIVRRIAPKSRIEITSRIEKLRADYSRAMNSAIKGKIGMSNN